MPRMTIDARRALIEDRRAQILTAAARVFSEKGFNGATIRDVAEGAGIAEGSIYNYFKNKDELLIRIPRQFLEPRLQALRNARLSTAGEQASPETFLTTVAQNMVEVLTQNREVMRVLMTSLPSMSAELRREYMQEVPLVALTALSAYVKEQQAGEVFRRDLAPEIVARTFASMLMFFLFMQEVLQPDDFPRLDYDRVIHTVVQIFLNGVITNQARGKVKSKSRRTQKTARERKIR